MLVPVYSPNIRFTTGWMATIVKDQPTPTGWLHCDGSAVSRTTYADLNSIMSAASYPYGNGNGSTTFDLPDEDKLFPWEDASDPQEFKLIIKT